MKIEQDNGSVIEGDEGEVIHRSFPLLNPDVMRAMRMLFRHGVTNFVVTDAFWNRLELHRKYANELLSCHSIPDDEEVESLTFHGRRVIRRSDLDRIGFSDMLL